jgi:ABC-2 type transport system permease protein
MSLYDLTGKNKMTIKENSSPFLKVFMREIHRMMERKTIYMLSIFLPIAVFMLISYIYTDGVIHDLPVAIYDQDHAELSRLITRAVDATSGMAVVKYVNSVDEIKAEMMKGNIQGAFCFEKNMTAHVKQGKSTTVVVYKNTANLIYGNMLYKDGMTIVRTVSAGLLLRKLKLKGTNEAAAMPIVSPVSVESHSLYNPSYNYTSFLVPGLLPAIFQMIIMVVGVLLISSEFTHHTFGDLASLANYNVFTILFGKAVPHILVHSATALGIIGIIMPVFKIEINGSTIILFLYFLLFICACLFLSLLISCLVENQMMATEAAVFISTPAFIFSGYSFPLWGMPAAHNIFAQIIPFTHFLSGLLKIYQMNAPLKYIVPDVLKLSIFFIGPLILTLIILKIKVKKYRGITMEAEA